MSVLPQLTMRGARIIGTRIIFAHIIGARTIRVVGEFLTDKLEYISGIQILIIFSIRCYRTDTCAMYTRYTRSCIRDLVYSEIVYIVYIVCTGGVVYIV
jgi:hypothetical protein